MQILPQNIYTKNNTQNGLFAKSNEFNKLKNAVQTLGSIDFDSTQFDVQILPNGIIVGLRSQTVTETPKSFKISAVSSKKVYVYGGVVRYHGKWNSTLADSEIDIAGGTFDNPTYVYVSLDWASRVTSLKQSIVAPVTNNTELMVVLFTCYINASDAVQILKVYFDGDIQLSSPISD